MNMRDNTIKKYNSKLVKLVSAASISLMFVSSQSIAITPYDTIDSYIITEEVVCLAENVYHESRAEPFLGKIAVAWVTINRVNLDQYPETICGVVHDSVLDSNGYPKRHMCQFSWYCDGKSDEITEKQSWQDSLKIAYLVYYIVPFDPTHGATMFHGARETPSWKKHFERTAHIGGHIFYK